MLRNRSRLAALSSCALLTACGGSPPRPFAAVAAQTANAHGLSFDDDASARLPRYRSKRLGLSLPLPRGSEWKIDDHSRPELFATHPQTRSRVTVAVLWTDEIVGRTQCEALARQRKLVFGQALAPLDDEVAVTQGTFDTQIRVGFIAGGGPDHPLVGHVMAFGGHLRKCYVFDFATEVESARDEAALSSRLAFARARILGGLVLESMGATSRKGPPRAEVAPGR